MNDIVVGVKVGPYMCGIGFGDGIDSSQHFVIFFIIHS